MSADRSSAGTPAAQGASHAATEPGSGRFGVRLILVLALFSATGPLAMDLYLPSFPQIAESLRTDPAQVQLTFTAFVVGLGIGQIVWGPITDRFGRVKPLLVGTILFMAASALVALSPSIELFQAGRFVQALAAAGGVVAARAIIADTVRGYAASHMMSIMTTITMIAPVLAPVVGSVLAVTIDWRGVLWTLFGMTVLMFIGAITTVRESLPIERRAPKVDYRNLLRVLARPAFLGYALTGTFGFGTMVVYIGASSFIYQEVIGFTTIGFGIAFAVNACGLIAAGLVSARLAKRRVHPARVVFTVLPILAFMAASVLVIAVTGAPSVMLVVPIFFCVAAVGFISGNCMALALEEVQDLIGAGSAAAGGLQFLLGGVITVFAGIGGGATAVPLGATMTACAVTALVCFAVVRVYARRNPRADDAFATAAA